ncbi:LysR family transcriptional regulator [Granulosicoccus sp. 3-233]|uniref:LysR family transcriptional regulator n=1 Tax=Granulosicoccus sp. 3-233 TaxID=3417969 RepID=UPI003D34D261
MNEKIVQWSDLHLFLAVAREGGLSPAARATGSSAATLGRRMLQLERAMGRELFIRHDRGYELTADARELLQQLTDVESRIGTLTARPVDARQPLVKVSAGTWTTLLLLRNHEALSGSPPDLKLRFVQAEDILNIPRREVTIGFRNQRPTDDHLATRKLQRVEFAPYAVAGAPERWIRVIADTPSARWLKRIAGNDGVCEVNTPRNSLDLVMVGVGIALLPTFIGDSEAELQRKGGTIAELSHDQWIVTHQDDRHLPEVRRAIDRLCSVLG